MDADGAQFSPANTGQRHELEYVGDAQFGDLFHGPYRVRLVQESLLVGVGEQGAQGRLGPRHRRGLLPAAQLREVVPGGVDRAGYRSPAPSGMSSLVRSA